jgi:hypothetical protein
MIKLFADEKTVYHLQEYAVVENEGGTYEYVAWDSNDEKLSWIRGEARIFGDVLGLTSITSEGEEEGIETLLELKYELSQLPAWDKTRYYCVITQGRDWGLLKYCGTGQVVDKDTEEHKRVEENLETHGLRFASQFMYE